MVIETARIGQSTTVPGRETRPAPVRRRKSWWRSSASSASVD